MDHGEGTGESSFFHFPSLSMLYRPEQKSNLKSTKKTSTSKKTRQTLQQVHPTKRTQFEKHPIDFIVSIYSAQNLSGFYAKGFAFS